MLRDDGSGMIAVDVVPRVGLVIVVVYQATLRKKFDVGSLGSLPRGVLLLHYDSRPHTAHTSTARLHAWCWERRSALPGALGF